MSVNEQITTKEPKDQPLNCQVIDNRLVISIGVDTLAFSDAERTGIDVIDPLEFAKDVAKELTREDEIGASPLTDLLDEVMDEACNRGSIGVEHETKVIINAREKKLTSGFGTYEDVCRAAGKDPESMPTITYSKGWAHDSRGTLLNGEKVRLKTGMIFDCCHTA